MQSDRVKWGAWTAGRRRPHQAAADRFQFAHVTTDFTATEYIAKNDRRETPIETKQFPFV